MLQLWSLSHLVSHSLITPLGVSHLILHPSWILYDDANYHSPVSNGVHPHDLWIFAIVIWWMHKEPLLMQPACPLPCLPARSLLSYRPGGGGSMAVDGGGWMVGLSAVGRPKQLDMNWALTKRSPVVVPLKDFKPLRVKTNFMGVVTSKFRLWRIIISTCF